MLERPQRLVAAAPCALALVFVSACGEGVAPGFVSADPDVEIARTVRDATEAVISGDERRFVRAHVQKGDMTPDGGSWITTAAGGRVPDAAWDDELRAAFRQARQDLERIAGSPSDLAFREIRDLETGTHGASDADWFSRVTAVVDGPGAAYHFAYDTGMLSKRGWVLTGKPRVTISKAVRD
jgi:hypothetical protein